MPAMRSDTLDVGGGPLHVADFGGSGRRMVLVHGLGGSHANWLAVAPQLAERFAVTAPDLAGFGLTPPAGRSSSVPASTALLSAYLDHLGEPVVLVGNSMGGLVSMQVAARHPDRVSALVLADPALPTPLRRRPNLAVLGAFVLYTVPGVGEAYVRRRTARLGPERMVDETMKLCTVDPARIPPAVLQAHHQLARTRRAFPYALDAYLEAARSVVRELAQRRRMAATMRSITAPTLLLHGDHDRLVDIEAARIAARTCPSWRFEVFADTGHVPMLEIPDRFVDSVLRFCDTALADAA
jgi:pimeloyl-ACP methyl ester carboxylesterase